MKKGSVWSENNRGLQTIRGPVNTNRGKASCQFFVSARALNLSLSKTRDSPSQSDAETESSYFIKLFVQTWFKLNLHGFLDNISIHFELRETTAHSQSVVVHINKKVFFLAVAWKNWTIYVV